LLPPGKLKEKKNKENRVKKATYVPEEVLWKLYILETQNEQLYTGITNNIERRIKEHREGRGARFTRIFGFKRLLYTENYPTRSDALKRESQIKTWPREKKYALIDQVQEIKLKKGKELREI